jgi:hypothetical protein
LLGWTGSHRTLSHNDIDLAFDQFSSDLAESIRVRASKPALKDDILSLRVTELM